MIWLKQSTASTVSMGPFLLNSDGVTLVTNLVGTGSNQTESTTTGIRISKNGGAFAARHAAAGTSTYDAFGNYLVILDTTDTNTLGVLRMQFANGAAFCPVWLDFMVVPANVWDSMFGASYLKTDVTTWLTGTIPAVNVTGVPLVDAKYLLGTIFPTPTVAGVPNVNVKTVNDVATTPVTTIKAVQGLTTADTIVTYTGNTVQTGDAYARIGANGVSLSAIPDEAGVTTLLSRLSATRAGYLDNLSAGAAALQSSLSTLITTVGAAGAGLTAADDAVIAAIVALQNLAAGAAMTLTSGERNAIADALYARSLGTEAVSVDNAVPTFAQALFEILSLLGEFSISGTTITCYKRNGTTPLFTSTLDSATVPASRTRAT